MIRITSRPPSSTSDSRGGRAGSGFVAAKGGSSLRALKKAGDDLNKFGQAVTSALTPKKRDSVKAEPTVKAGESTKTGDDKDATTSTDTDKGDGDSGSTD